MFLTESIRPRPRAQEPSLPFLPSTVPFASVILSTGVQISGPVHMSRSWNASGSSQVGGGLVPTYHPRTISRLYLPKYWDVAHRNRPDLSLSLFLCFSLSLFGDRTLVNRTIRFRVCWRRIRRVEIAWLAVCLHSGGLWYFRGFTYTCFDRTVALLFS